MIWTSTMGNATNHLSLCVSSSSRKTRRERPYVSRPFWPYEHHYFNNNSTSNALETSHLRLTHPIIDDHTRSRSIHIIKIPSRH